MYHDSLAQRRDQNSMIFFLSTTRQLVEINRTTTVHQHDIFMYEPRQSEIMTDVFLYRNKFHFMNEFLYSHRPTKMNTHD
jgi:hypothetical protein